MTEIDQTDRYPELFNSPALRISNIVYGKENIGGRVHYFPDDRFDSTFDKVIPEQVVLYRWRRRVFNNLSFKGFRLSPNIWRSIGLSLGADANFIASLDETAIEELFERSRDVLRDQNYPTPSPSNLSFMFKAIKKEKLQLILNRQLSSERTDRYGTPDLFLLAMNPETNNISTVRFVDVKKPKEPLSIDQVEEIKFLRKIGLKARVLRLAEADK